MARRFEISNEMSFDPSAYSGHCRDVKDLTFHWIFQLTYPLQRCEGPDISFDISTYLAIAEMWRAWHFIGYFRLTWHIAEMWRTWHFIGYFSLPIHCRDVKDLTFHLIFQLTWPSAEMWRYLTFHWIFQALAPDIIGSAMASRDVKDLTFHVIFHISTWPLQRCEGPDISLDISAYLAIAEMWRTWHFIGYFRLTYPLQRCEGTWHFKWYFRLPGHCRDVKDLTFHLIFQLTWPLQRCEGPDISLDISAYLSIAEMWRTWHFIGYFSLPIHCRDVKGLTFHLIFQFTWPLQRYEGPDISLWYFSLPGHCRDVKDLTFHLIFQLT